MTNIILGKTLYFRVCTLMELLPVLVGMGDTLGLAQLCLMRDTFVKKKNVGFSLFSILTLVFRLAVYASCYVLGLARHLVVLLTHLLTEEAFK